MPEGDDNTVVQGNLGETMQEEEEGKGLAADELKQKESNLNNSSNQLEKHTKQLSKIEGIVQQLPKYLKNADTQSRMLKEINTSIKQLQRQIGQIQKNTQKKK